MPQAPEGVWEISPFLQPLWFITVTSSDTSSNTSINMLRWVLFHHQYPQTADLLMLHVIVTLSFFLHFDIISTRAELNATEIFKPIDRPYGGMKNVTHASVTVNWKSQNVIQVLSSW